VNHLESPLRSVLVVSDFASINGGGAKVAIDGARLSAEAGLDVTFFALVGPIAPELAHPKITVVCLDQSDILHAKSRGKAALQGIWNTEAARALSDVMADMDPQTTVMHVHSYIKAISPAIGPLLARGVLKNVFTMHDYFLACPNGGFYDYQKGEICTRKAMSMSCLTTQCDVRKASHKAWRVLRQAISQTVGALPRGLKHIIYISEFQKKIMEPYLSAGCEMYHVPNPVEISNASRNDPRSRETFLFIGRLNPEKGAALFAQAAQMAGAQAVFVGDGQDRHKILEVNPQAQILGWKTPSEVQELIQTARCVVFPSLWYECQPLVPIEALHAGIPVIAGRWTAARETVEHNRTGVLVDTPDVETFASAITALSDDAHPVFERIQSYVPSYTPEAHQQALLKTYCQVIQS
jgi:glycosyltransferase involved in cell wall biosynthesis